MSDKYYCGLVKVLNPRATPHIRHEFIADGMEGNTSGGASEAGGALHKNGVLTGIREPPEPYDASPQFILGPSDFLVP